MRTRTLSTRPDSSNCACRGAASRPRPVIASYTSDAPPAVATRVRKRRRVSTILPPRCRLHGELDAMRLVARIVCSLGSHSGPGRAKGANRESAAGVRAWNEFVRLRSAGELREFDLPRRLQHEDDPARTHFDANSPHSETAICLVDILFDRGRNS